MLRLKKDAVPSIFSEYPCYMQPKVNKLPSNASFRKRAVSYPARLFQVNDSGQLTQINYWGMTDPQAPCLSRMLYLLNKVKLRRALALKCMEGNTVTFRGTRKLP